MNIREVDNLEYDGLFEPDHVFNKASFNHLNRDKAEEVKYLVVLEEGNAKAGIIGGIKNKWFLSPFSASYGGWFYKGKVDIIRVENSYDELELWASQNKLEGIKIVYPPLFHDDSAVSLALNVALRKGYELKIVDLNFQFDLSKFNDTYLDSIAYNARKNYKIGDKSNLIVTKVTEQSLIRQAYDIISLNRQQRGFPLKMTFENIEQTIKIIDADFFIVYNASHIAVASAMVFKVTNNIAQVVYWGHNMEYSALKPVNYLSYELFRHYKQMGLKYLDIGPSTDAGIPNVGLIEFKQSIGCDISPKFTLEKILT